MEKICTICGNTYTKRKTCSKKEWEKSSCCSRACSAVHLSRLYKGKAPKNVYEWSHYKRTPKLHICAGCNQEFQYRKELNGLKQNIALLNAVKNIMYHQ